MINPISYRKMLLLLLVLIVFVGLLYFFRHRLRLHYEMFGDPFQNKKTPQILDLTQQFDDMIVYDNEPNGRLGLDKCIELCKGYCVEFGLTGTAYCFPVSETPYQNKVMIPQKDFNGNIVQNEQKLSFPSIE